MTYASLDKKIRKLGLQINVPDEYYPILGQPRDLDNPYIEIRFPFYYWVVTERGKELERKKFRHVDDLLYGVFNDIISTMSTWYEVDNRVKSQDFRRIMFAHQLELMGKLSNEWKSKRQIEIDEILKRSPYDDELARIWDSKW